MIERPSIESTLPLFYKPSDNGRYHREAGAFPYTPHMQRTGEGLVQSRALIPEGFRMSTMFDEMGIIELFNTDPRTLLQFADLFDPTGYVTLLTDTVLRSPDGYKHGQADRRTGKYPRIVVVNDQEVGDIQIPKTTNGLVVEIDPVFGLPIQTVRKGKRNYANHQFHLLYDSDIERDIKTLGVDEVITVTGITCANDKPCFLIGTERVGYERENTSYGVRLIKGPVPAITKIAK